MADNAAFQSGNWKVPDWWNKNTTSNSTSLTGNSFNDLLNTHKANQIDLMKTAADLDINQSNNNFGNQTKQNTQLQDFNKENKSLDYQYQTGLFNTNATNEITINQQKHSFDVENKGLDYNYDLGRTNNAADNTMRVNTQLHGQGLERDTHQTNESMRLNSQANEFDLGRRNLDQSHYLAKKDDDRKAALNLYRKN